jgi:hypothetical protein
MMLLRNEPGDRRPLSRDRIGQNLPAPGAKHA